MPKESSDSNTAEQESEPESYKLSSKEIILLSLLVSVMTILASCNNNQESVDLANQLDDLEAQFQGSKTSSINTEIEILELQETAEKLIDSIKRNNPRLKLGEIIGVEVYGITEANFVDNARRIILKVKEKIDDRSYKIKTLHLNETDGDVEIITYLRKTTQDTHSIKQVLQRGEPNQIDYAHRIKLEESLGFSFDQLGADFIQQILNEIPNIESQELDADEQIDKKSISTVIPQPTLILRSDNKIVISFTQRAHYKITPSDKGHLHVDHSQTVTIQPLFGILLVEQDAPIINRHKTIKQ